MGTEEVDAAAYDALHEAERIIEQAVPDTPHGSTTLESAARILALLKIALVAAEAIPEHGTPRRSGS
jgi:hypothetical protein